jgi:hypothetical protein
MKGTARRMRHVLTAGVLGMALLLAVAPAASAATLIGHWKLLGNFKNAAGATPTMAKLGDTAFETVDVAGKSRKALVFDEGEGAIVRKIPKAGRASYSISLYLRLDDVAGYRRLVAFGPNTRDAGLYVEDGYLDLYPKKESSAPVIGPDEWVRVLVTRNGATGRMVVYVNGVRKLAYRDVIGQYKLKKGIAVLLQDDGGEHPSGVLANVRVHSGVAAP